MGHARQLGLAYISLHTPVLMESELGKSENIGQNSDFNTFQQLSTRIKVSNNNFAIGDSTCACAVSTQPPYWTWCITVGYSLKVTKLVMNSTRLRNGWSFSSFPRLVPCYLAQGTKSDQFDHILWDFTLSTKTRIDDASWLDVTYKETQFLKLLEYLCIIDSPI